MARQPYSELFTNRSLMTFKMFERLGAFPLDPTSVFDTKDEANTYVNETGSNAYAGQILAVANGSITTQGETDFDIYVVRTDKSLQKISFSIKDVPEMSWNTIIGKPTSTVENIDDAVTKRHTHDNKAVLDVLKDENGVLTYNDKGIALVEDLVWDKIQNKPTKFTPDTHTHDDVDIVSVSATKITGVLSMDNIPKGALERLHVVENKEAMLKLTKDEIQTGDTVKLNDTGIMYYVKDDTKLTTEEAFEEYKVGAASYVEWTGVKNTPTNLTGYGITDAVNVSEISTTAEANKLLKLNGDSKLPASITGDAATVGGKAITEISLVGHDHDVATTQANGYMSKDDKSKLDGIAENANNYVHPSTHPATMIVEDDTRKFVNKEQVEKLAGIEAGAKVNVQSDWNVEDTGLDSFIKNKPTSLPAKGGHSDTTGKLQKAVNLAINGDVKGDVMFDGSGDTAINVSLNTTGVLAGTYKSVTVDNKGRITSGTNPNTLGGYGITDAVESGDVVTAAIPNKILKLNGEGKLPTSITGDAMTVGGRNADSFANKTHTHKSDDIESLDASKIVGVLSINQIPQGALEKLVPVENDEAMLKLTINEVQNGDTVQVMSSKIMYFVKDETKLGTMAAFNEYTSGTAASVSWSGVKDRPTTLDGYGITDAIPNTDVVTTPVGSKLLKLDTNGKLPADITGKAGSVDWANVNDKPTSTPQEIDGAVTSANHANRDKLDKIGEDANGLVTYNGKTLATKEEVGNKIVLSETEPTGLTSGGVWLSIVKN